MTPRERIIQTLRGEVPSDRIPQTDTAFWTPTIERWRKEGLPENIVTDSWDWPFKNWDYFGLDPVWPAGVWDGSLRLPYKIFEETDEYIVDQSSDGVKCKGWKKHYAPGAELDFTIRTFDDWKKYRHRLDVDPKRFGAEGLEYLKKVREMGIFTCACPIEPYWYVLRTLGHENALLQTALEPAFVDDMLRCYTDFILDMLDIMWEGGNTFDSIWFFSDLCYRNGMLFSPKTYKSLLRPYHQEVKKWCREHGVFLLLHCDGFVEEFIPLLIEVGFDAIEPLEVRAGNDLFRIKKNFGKNITLWGGINADALATNDRRKIEEEIVPKIEMAKAGGRYMYHIDHSVPPGVSLESYKYALSLVKKHGTY